MVGLGSIRSHALWKCVKDLGITTRKPDYVYAMKFLVRQGFVHEDREGHRTVFYWLTEGYDLARQFVSNLEEHTKRVRKFKNDLMRSNFSDPDLYRAFVYEAFKLQVEIWLGLSALPRVKKEFRSVAVIMFGVSSSEAMLTLQELGRFRPSAMNSAIKLIDGLLEGVALDLHQILLPKEHRGKFEAFTTPAAANIQRTMNELAIWADAELPNLKVLKLPSVLRASSAPVAQSSPGV